MGKCNIDKINEINLLKIILILKILYHCTSDKKLSSKVKEKDIRKNITTKVNEPTQHDNSNNQMKKYKKYKVYKLPLKTIIKKNKSSASLVKNKGIYLSESFNKKLLNVPVVISEKNVSIPLENNIEFKNYALEVKNIENHVYITDSKVFPVLDKGKMDLSKGKVIIEGVVRSILEYSTIDGVYDDSLDGCVKHRISFIPFKCMTIVNYSHLPIFKHNKEHKVDDINCSLKQVEIFISNSYSGIKKINNTYYLGKMFKAVHQKLILKLNIYLTQIQKVIIENVNNK